MTDIETEPEDSPFIGAPPAAQHKVLKPFGTDPSKNMMMKEEALRTMSREECFKRGFLTVKDLDDEELRYGRGRDINGNIPNRHGKRTDLIPRERYDEMVAEHELRFKQKLRQRLDDMLDVMTDIALDDTCEPKDRFEAAKYIFERTAGKTPETVTVNVKHAPWEDLLSQVAGIAPMSRAEHLALGVGIVDAEVVEYDSPEETWTGDEGGPEDRQQGYTRVSGYSTREAPVATATEEEVTNVGTNDTGTAGQAVQAQRPVNVADSMEGEQSAADNGDTMGGASSDASHAATNVAEGVRSNLGVDEYWTEGDIRQQGVPVRPDNRSEYDAAAGRADVPDQPERAYGRRADENRSYAQQAHEAQDLAKRRKEFKQKIQNAKKQRKIARALGADAITDEITGTTVDENGNVTFEQ